MRPLKFRAWDNKQHLMYPLVDVHCCTDITSVSLAGTSQHGVIFSPPLNDLILMQYIGLIDKRGKEIFEGDILYLGLGKHRLEVRYSVMGFRLYDLDAQEWHLLWAADMKRLEIIGNIYETPPCKDEV